MRTRNGIRTAAAAVLAAAVLTLGATACSSGGGHDEDAAGKDPGTATAPATAPTGTAPVATPGTGGLTTLADGPRKDAFLAAVRAVDPALAADPDRALANGRTQCKRIATDPETADHLTAERFGSPDHPLTDAQGAAINSALKLTLCRP
ncbi:hypothetical protein [Actinacidiphila guanduensis]|uniref:DUF732 domain-containing protein n=1 Tax=Actinacidiphila guanduensis TaxID=310781 RepID=A0A1G9YKD7_9ACTN|nr:hypothetical protein [Actinacidiphila guanduensis]SDN08935.1 hypothetical protein SAMN05216259_102581 [Actinacidiphila guanduensis]